MYRNLKLKAHQKELIVANFLISGQSFREYGTIHGIDFRTLNSWVRKFQGAPLKKQKKIKTNTTQHWDEQLPTDVKQLQEELRKARLYNELLNTMIDLAEDQLKIDIRKKSGTKQ
ncbi:MAG: hypothetical protein FGM54_00040 [Chitinophagaceae bacterium]|nr:hypothetical protein [Chitinophagaceae bacterium]